MLLIGAREANGSFFFLLQNWWEDKFFVEVSAEYMFSSNALISFVAENIVEIPTTFACTNCPYSETSIDACERLDHM
jgi:hypothetical protein